MTEEGAGMAKGGRGDDGSRATTRVAPTVSMLMRVATRVAPTPYANMCRRTNYDYL